MLLTLMHCSSCGLVDAHARFPSSGWPRACLRTMSRLGGDTMYKFAVAKQLGFAALLSFVLTLNAHAQPDRSGSVNGTVSNSSGAPIVSITVQLESIDNGSK